MSRWRAVDYIVTWLLLMVAFLAALPWEFLTVPLGGASGVVLYICYVWMSKRRRTAPSALQDEKSPWVGVGLHAVAVLALFCMPIIITTLFGWLMWDPIGSEWDFELIPSDCETAVISNVASSGGIVASIARSDCSGLLAGEGWSRFFVFVHGRDEHNGRENLALRYENWEDDDPPRVRWVSAQALSITLPVAGDEITKQRTHLGSIQLSYGGWSTEYRHELSIWSRAHRFLPFIPDPTR